METPRDGLHCIEDLRGVAQEIFPVLGQRQRARRAIKQRPPDLFFESPDLMADSGLRQIKPTCSLGKSACFGNGDKRAQQARIKIHGRSSDEMIYWMIVN